MQLPLQHQQSKQRECPTEYAEHTEHSGRESLPQIGTDAHRLGGYGIPAIPTLPITQPNHLWKSVKSVGENPLPETSVNSVKSVGEYPTLETSVNSVNSVGGLQRVAWVWQDAIPSYENSHRLHGCAQIRKQQRNLKICEHL